jgi:hypothetical protein
VQPFGGLVILELKFTDRFPGWFSDMVQQFGLTRGASAKYCEDIASLLHPEHANWPIHPVDAPLVDSHSLPVLKLADPVCARAPGQKDIVCPPSETALPRTALAT